MSIEASIHPVEIPVGHDNLAHATVRVANQGELTCQLGVEITGAAAQWSWVTPATLTLAPGATGEVRASFKAPRASLPPAGPLPVAVQITGSGPSAGPVVVEATLVVAGFTDVFATIEPPVSRGSGQGRHRLTLENRGNAAAPVALTGAASQEQAPPDPSATPALALVVEPSRCSVAPGAQATAEITAQATRTFLRGRPRDHPFRVAIAVEGAGTGSATSVGAVMRQHQSMPGWLPRATLGAAGVVIAAVAGMAMLGPGDPPPRPDASILTVDAECPAAGHLGGIAHGQAQELTASGYAFLYADDGGCRPIRFPACTPVHYVLNDALAPPGAVDDVHAAVDRLAAATGLELVYDGTTDEALDVRRSAYQPDRYGQRWAPILIGWSALGTGSGPDGSGDDIIVAGRGNPVRVGDSLVSGVLELNADVILDRETQERLPGGFGEGITRGRVLLHELGHVIGLGHVSSTAQLMYPELAEQTSSTAEYGVGDRVGLRLVGREAGCLEAPPLPTTSG